MLKSDNLSEYLEEYLRREALSDAIVEHRKASLVNAFGSALILVTWLGELYLLAALFIVVHVGIRAVTAGFLIPTVAFVALFIGLVIWYLIRQFRHGEELSAADSNTIGGIFLFIFPLLIAILIGIYLNSWLVLLQYILVCVGALIITILVHAFRFRIYGLLEIVRAAIKIIWQSITLLPMLVPTLLLVVLLSIFSEELWSIIGGLTQTRLMLGALSIVLPVFLFALFSLRQETRRIVGDFPKLSKTTEIARKTPFIKDKLDEELISNEEWAELVNDLQWRHRSKLAENVIPVVYWETGLRFAMLLILSALVLFLTFTGYFYILFNIFFEPARIIDWSGISVVDTYTSFTLLGYVWELDSPQMVIIKVSLFLSTFVSILASVYALTEESFKGKFTGWLREKTASWLAISTLHRVAASPGYQIWEYVVRNEQKGIFNVSIVVPKGLTDEQVKAACRHMESRITDAAYLIIVTAFEQKLDDSPQYRLGMPGRRWRFLHNKSKDIRQFESIHLAADEIRYQHTLGSECQQKGDAIPEEWFGNTAQARKLAKAVWESDHDKELVMHPYAFENEDLHVMSLEIHLTKRLPHSEDYREYMRQLLDETRQRVNGAKMVWLELCFRETLDTLARLEWNADLGFVNYRDEIQGGAVTENLNKWID